MSALMQRLAEAMRDDWPKLLIGAVIPASQYAWKVYQDRSLETKKSALRKKIKELSEFLTALASTSDVAVQLKDEAQREYNQALEKLACLGRVPSASSRGIPENQFRRWFLLYLPQRPIAWIPQTLYFLLLAFIAMAIFGLLVSLDDPDIGYGLLGVAVYAAIALCVRAWAATLNQPKSERRPARRWLPITAFTVTAIFEFFLLIGAAVDDENDFSIAAFTQNIWLVIISLAVAGAIALVCLRSLKRTKFVPLPVPVRLEETPMQTQMPASVEQPTNKPEELSTSA